MNNQQTDYANIILNFQQPIYKNGINDDHYITSDIKNKNLFKMKNLVQILERINSDHCYSNNNDNNNGEISFHIDDSSINMYHGLNALSSTEWEKWRSLSTKTDQYTIKLLEQNLDKVDWEMLSGNPWAIDILEKNLDKINCKTLSENPRAINILVNNPNLINFNSLLKNKNLYKIFGLLKMTDFYNEIPEEIKFKIKRKINGDDMSYINNFYDEDYNEIIWSELNEKDNLHNSEKTMFKNENFSWLHLSEKINSVEILRNKLPFYRSYFREKIIKNIDKGLLKYIVLPLDYEKMKINNKIFCEDLCKYVFNPIRLLRFAEKLNLNLDDYLEQI